MNSNRWLLIVLVVALESSALVAGQTPQPQTPAADNTKTNKSEAAKPNADQQGQSQSDVEITARIRQLVTDDKALSTYAKNIKIITQRGNVTLSGPVRSADEKKSVEAKANQVAGNSHVKSEIQIAAQEPEQKKK